MLDPTFTAGFNVAMTIPLPHYEAPWPFPAEFRESARLLLGRVVGKEYWTVGPDDDQPATGSNCGKVVD